MVELVATGLFAFILAILGFIAVICGWFGLVLLGLGREAVKLRKLARNNS
jgi:hypothetical protein